MNAFIDFLFDFINGLAGAWTWLTTPLSVEIAGKNVMEVLGLAVTPLGLLGIGSIIVIVGFKLFKLINPLSQE